SCVRSYPDFPQPGIIFRDIFSVMQQPTVFADLMDVLIDYVKAKHKDIDAIIGLDSRGFLFGPIICLQLGIPFVPVRKKGKLPGDLMSTTYQLEYGSDVFEVQKDSFKPGDKIVIIDDLLATGGTMSASVDLVKKNGGVVEECICIIEIDDLKGRNKLKVPFKSFIQF
ncbi:PREDICTED: adenine phosphoribosyltransferase-like, partial [Priapulus caudatus]|uniref:Adenine phosphoribosyltransferase n=1 Tax=Priapulus caudatus TaxID=37621 RepID=A0ABM1ESW4_PRICU